MRTTVAVVFEVSLQSTMNILGTMMSRLVNYDRSRGAG